MIYADPPEHELQAKHIIDTALATAAYAARTSLHSTMEHSPGQLVFQRDMLLDIPVIADFQLLKEKRQQQGAELHHTNQCCGFSRFGPIWSQTPKI